MHLTKRNSIRQLTVVALSLTYLLAPIAAFAADQNAKPTPDKLTTCPVSGDKLGEMGKPYVFEYQGQEVKLCCKSCKKDFDKDPAKYLKKIREADPAAPSTKDAKN
jgi:YHS domain-containing protein